MTKQKIDETFSALSDSTRRHIVELLAICEAMRVSELAEKFNTTRQAVTKHLDVLCDAGLVVTERQGRERISRISEGAFDPILEWLSDYERFWDSKLNDLKTLIERGEAQ